MSIKPLSDVLAVRGGQEAVAKKIGVHQTAVSKAKRENRNIFIVEDENGVTAFEVKPVFNTNPNLADISSKLIAHLDPA